MFLHSYTAAMLIKKDNERRQTTRQVSLTFLLFLSSYLLLIQLKRTLLIQSLVVFLTYVTYEPFHRQFHYSRLIITLSFEMLLHLSLLISITKCIFSIIAMHKKGVIYQ